MLNISTLNVLNCRKTEYAPIQFAKIKISEDRVYESYLDVWIRTKLRGRYCIYSTPSISESGSLKTSTFVSFEDHKELTYFMLACPFLRRFK